LQRGKGLALDDHLAEAYTSLAYATLLYDWDWSGAEQKFRRAIELIQLRDRHHFYSIYLMAAGRHAEAQAEIRRAQALDPFSLIINSVVGWIYYEGRQYDQAIQQCEKTVEMDPNYAPALLDLGNIYLQNRRLQEGHRSIRTRPSRGWGQEYCLVLPRPSSGPIRR